MCNVWKCICDVRDSSNLRIYSYWGKNVPMFKNSEDRNCIRTIFCSSSTKSAYANVVCGRLCAKKKWFRVPTCVEFERNKKWRSLHRRGAHTIWKTTVTRDPVNWIRNGGWHRPMCRRTSAAARMATINNFERLTNAHFRCNPASNLSPESTRENLCPREGAKRKITIPRSRIITICSSYWRIILCSTNSHDVIYLTNARIAYLDVVSKPPELYGFFLNSFAVIFSSRVSPCVE